ncbi:MAG TPA: DUF6452 family protein [Chitinophaga sp.]|uniref:DUF6452 family protein n=1 Tax=Chitinophaga sp. TaxID=1869181 RepID=UPI002CC91843|nr:DUF6452 family protein [Chitinophaga sp.]HVI43295.1 DUF6452 family protein [Chitinophaga sp.]
MKTIHQILLACFIFAAFMACENETKVCDQTLSTNLRANFKRDTAIRIRDTVIHRITDTIMPKVVMRAVGRDSLLYNRVATQNIFAPLSPIADSSRYSLQLDSALVSDTLTFRYKRSTHFISPGCGFGTYFLLDTVLTTHNTIDSLVINLKSVTSSNDTHLTLFLYAN